MSGCAGAVVADAAHAASATVSRMSRRAWILIANLGPSADATPSAPSGNMHDKDGRTTHMRSIVSVIAVVCCLSRVTLAAELPKPASGPATAPARYPLKTARTLHSDAEIAQARENIEKY